MVVLRLPAHLKDRLRRAANLEQVSMATLIRGALETTYGLPNPVPRQRRDRLLPQELKEVARLAGATLKVGGLLKMALTRPGQVDRTALRLVLDQVKRTGAAVAEINRRLQERAR